MNVSGSKHWVDGEGTVGSSRMLPRVKSKKDGETFPPERLQNVKTNQWKGGCKPQRIYITDNGSKVFFENLQLVFLLKVQVTHFCKHLAFWFLDFSSFSACSSFDFFCAQRPFPRSTKEVTFVSFQWCVHRQLTTRQQGRRFQFVTVTFFFRCICIIICVGDMINICIYVQYIYTYYICISIIMYNLNMACQRV